MWERLVFNDCRRGISSASLRISAVRPKPAIGPFDTIAIDPVLDRSRPKRKFPFSGGYNSATLHIQQKIAVLLWNTKIL
jgi:hypothetical protein